MGDQQTVEPSVAVDWTEFESPSAGVVAAVADAAGTGPLELNPLYETVDPDALDRLFASTTRSHRAPSGRIEFEYEEYSVVVKANGRCYVYDRDERRHPSAESRQYAPGL